MDVNQALKDRVNEGLEKIKLHFDNVIDVEVILSEERHQRLAEFNLLANGLRINAKNSSTTDIEEAIDGAISKLDRQISKHKDRIMRHKPRTNREARSIEHSVLEMSEAEETLAEESEGLEHREVRREKVPLPSLTIDEAAFQLELLEYKFLVFTNAETNQVNVLYTRNDQTYGLIEPDGQVA